MNIKAKYARRLDKLNESERYNFKYNGNYAAVVKVYKPLDVDAYVYDIKINDMVMLHNNSLREIHCGDKEKLALVNMLMIKSFDTKEDALKSASKCARKILEEYSDISVKREREKLTN